MAAVTATRARPSALSARAGVLQDSARAQPGTLGRAAELLREGGPLDCLLLAYSQLFFSRSRWVGALMMAATLAVPRMFLAGAGGVLLATLLAQALRQSPDLIRSGMFGYNALLVGLACAALLEPGASAFALTLGSVLASVLVTAALHGALTTRCGLPALTMPFMLVFWALVAAAPALGVELAAFPGQIMPAPEWVPGFAAQGLRAMGTLLFLPRLGVGLLLLTALLLASRIAALLAVLAFAVAWLLVGAMPETEPLLLWLLALNLAFVAIALGGIWFVPGPSSLGLAGLGAALCVLVALGGQRLLGGLDLPLQVMPLNLVIPMMLFTMRQRVRDGSPKAVDFIPGTPEENLGYYRTRVARFGARYGLRFRAPFLGTWTCTQGVDGPSTHQGPWRHGLDFEVLGANGRSHRGRGTRPQDYHCWHLPVLAVADGVVAEVRDGQPDSPVGQPDLERRWGNVVVIEHGPGLFSLVAHLARGSIKLRPGQVVKQGETLGLCGSSGRSPVPHLHFQLQATAQVGSPTLAVELHDVIAVQDEDERLHPTFVPTEGQRLRNAEAQASIANLLRFEPGESLRLREGKGLRLKREALLSEVDLLGRRLLRSARHDAALVHDRQDGVFTVYEVLGSQDSALHLLRAALPRVPLEASEKLSWSDVVPVSPLIPWLDAPGLRLRALFRVHGGIVADYRLRKKGPDLEIRGTSRERGRDGEPVISTRILLRPGKGIQALRVRCCGRTRHLLSETIPQAGASGAQVSP